MIRSIVRSFGAAADVVGIEPCPPAPLGPGQVRVRMTVRSINPSDVVTISGAYASRTPLPFVPGFEGVGVVEEAADDVRGIGVGDRVLPIGSAGAWQDEKVTDAGWCFPVAPDLSDEEAATSYVNPLTAWLMLHHRTTLGEGMRIAVSAANSAIGRIIVRMANARGLEPVGIVRGSARAAELAGLGFSALLDQGRPGLLEDLRDASAGAGFDLALDAVGGRVGECLGLALRPGGRLIHYGLLSGEPIPPSLRRDRPDIGLELFWLRNWVHAADRAEVARALEHSARLIRDGTAATAIAARYPLARIRDALRHHEQGGRAGKILITP